MSEKEIDDLKLKAVEEDAKRREEVSRKEFEPPVSHEARIAHGYWLLDGRYGDHYSRVADFADLEHVWWKRGYERDTSQPYDGPDGWKWEARRLVRRAHDDGRRLMLTADIGKEGVPGIDEIVDTLGPFFDRVEWLDLYDEPSWSTVQTEETADRIRDVLMDAGLKVPKIGITMDRKGALTSSAVIARNLDFVALETYIPATEQNRPTALLGAELQQDFRRAADRIDHKLILIGMAFDRRQSENDPNTWRNEESLMFAQQINGALLEEFRSRVLAMTWFAYGRPGGVVNHPRMVDIHRSLAQKYR